MGNMNKKSILNYFFVCLFHVNFYALLAIERKIVINSIVNDCYISNKREICQKALIKLEFLQSQEAANQNYSCQTRLLGLQADLIMRMQTNGRRSPNKKLFKEIKQFCNYF